MPHIELVGHLALTRHNRPPPRATRAQAIQSHLRTSYPANMLCSRACRRLASPHLHHPVPSPPPAPRAYAASRLAQGSIERANSRSESGTAPEPNRFHQPTTLMPPVHSPSMAGPAAAHRPPLPPHSGSPRMYGASATQTSSDRSDTPHGSALQSLPNPSRQSPPPSQPRHNRSTQVGGANAALAANLTPCAQLPHPQTPSTSTSSPPPSSGGSRTSPSWLRSRPPSP